MLKNKEGGISELNIHGNKFEESIFQVNNDM